MEQHGRRDVGWDLIPCSAGTGRGVDTLLPALQRSCPENGSSFPPRPLILFTSSYLSLFPPLHKTQRKRPRQPIHPKQQQPPPISHPLTTPYTDINTNEKQTPPHGTRSHAPFPSQSAPRPPRAAEKQNSSQLLPLNITISQNLHRQIPPRSRHSTEPYRYVQE